VLCLTDNTLSEEKSEIVAKVMKELENQVKQGKAES